MVAGADLVQGRALPYRNEAVEVSERGRIGEDLDAGLAGLFGERARLLVAALPQQAPAGLGAFVDQHHVGAALGSRERGR